MFEAVMMTRDARGFTLLELIVALALAAVLGSLAVLGLTGWLPRYRMQAAGDEINALLQNARLRAIKENRAVVVRLEPDRSCYRAFFQTRFDRAADDRFDANEDVLVAEGRLPSGVQFRDADGTRLQNALKLRFNSRGQLAGIYASFRFGSSRERIRKVCVYGSGNIRIE